MADFEPIKIVGVITEEVGQPRNDGTPGSGLYAVPFQLSATPPSARWAKMFEATWDHPRQSTPMHRPGICRVTGDRIILDGTTIEEVEQYHTATLRLVLEDVNRAEAQALEQERQRKEREQAQTEAHRQNVDEVADRIKFDD